MQLREKINIDLLDFFKSSRFDYIKLGQTKEWILNNFPDPDGFAPYFLNAESDIWHYGNIEFHFNKQNRLVSIYCDYIETLDGSSYLAVDKWILADFKKLRPLDTTRTKTQTYKGKVKKNLQGVKGATLEKVSEKSFCTLNKEEKYSLP